MTNPMNSPGEIGHTRIFFAVLQRRSFVKKYRVSEVDVGGTHNVDRCWEAGKWNGTGS